MATKLTKKQQTQLTEKLTGIIRENNALQLRLSADRSVNEMNVNQISSELNRIHDMAIGRELPTVINIPVKQLGSGNPSPENIRPIVGYTIDGIGTVYGGELNIETGLLTIGYGFIRFSDLPWTYVESSLSFASGPVSGMLPGVDAFCNVYTVTSAYVTTPAWIAGNYLINVNRSDKRIRVKDTRFTTIDEFTAVFTDYVLIYALETLETYTLTPQQMIQLLDQL